MSSTNPSPSSACLQTSLDTLSTEPILAKVFELLMAELGRGAWTRYLDIGAGRGALVARVKGELKVETSVCDYTDELIRLPGQKVDLVDLNDEPLPYPDASFDAVTATEVIEHLADFRRVVREIYRVLKPGGVCVLSTPNILNLNSRLRFLTFGFWNLFGPLSVKERVPYATSGHINPVSWFYVAHALLDAGYRDVTPHADRWQRSALPKFVLLYPLIKLLGAWSMRKERLRHRTLDDSNERLVLAMNSVDMLLGRTLIVKAVKPS